MNKVAFNGSSEEEIKQLQRKILKTSDVTDDKLVQYFIKFYHKKHTNPLKTLDQAIEDFIVKHNSESVLSK